MKSRIIGLDSIRFICAFSVIIGHLGYPPLFAGLDETNIIAKIVRGIYNNSFEAPVAVIVFFVISGFCIHYPYRDGEKPKWVGYYGLRYIRIGVPLIAAMIMGYLVGLDLYSTTESIYWSLYCELIYYTIYPLLLWGSKKIGWINLIIGSFILAYLVVIFVQVTPFNANYPIYGIQLNWVVGLPCWLIGCYLANVLPSEAPKPTRKIVWSWRSAVIFTGFVCTTLRFQFSIGYYWTLDLFAIVTCFWLKQEIINLHYNPPPPILEWAGKWSYSLYITHLSGYALFILLPVPNFGYDMNWILLIFVVFCIAYSFYLIIELPSHKLARKIKRSADATFYPKRKNLVSNLKLRG